jgi:hypothetical protein
MAKDPWPKMRPFSFFLFPLFPRPQEGKKIVASAVNSDHPNRKQFLFGVFVTVF